MKKHYIFFAMLLGACSSDGGFTAADINAAEPQGLIAGDAFTMMAARISREGEELDVNLFAATPTDPCGFGLPEGDAILFDVPAAVGEYPLSFSFSDFANSRTVTLFEGPSNNIIASEGLIVVEALSDSEVTLGVVAESGNDFINGRLTATICPE